MRQSKLTHAKKKSIDGPSAQPLTVKVGEEYYLKCVLTMGAIVGEPSLRLIARGPGQLGYEGIK